MRMWKKTFTFTFTFYDHIDRSIIVQRGSIWKSTLIHMKIWRII